MIARSGMCRVIRHVDALAALEGRHSFPTGHLPSLHAQSGPHALLLPCGYFEIISIVRSHCSTNGGQPVIGKFVGRSPNACPPFTYKCSSTGTPPF